MSIYVIFGAAVKADGTASGSLYRRTIGALAFAKHNNDNHPLFIVSGAIGTYPPSEAIVMESLLIANGVAKSQIIKDEASTDTLETVQNCTKIIQSLHGVASMYVCTSPYHSWRCQLLFRIYRQPFQRANMPGDLAKLGLLKWTLYCIKEVVAIPWDVFLAFKNN
ncbi:YdcF family protein [Alteromonadaceae bacterium BrNp21-10]|nr:YdcF family protein [Alteromonadaceae bacterium BrNp21-10]